MHHDEPVSIVTPLGFHRPLPPYRIIGTDFAHKIGGRLSHHDLYEATSEFTHVATRSFAQHPISGYIVGWLIASHLC